MSGLARLSSTVSNLLRRATAQLVGSSSNFHSMAVETASLPNPGGLFSIAVRYNIRNHFPRPSERKRIICHGWKRRMTTPGGQKILMRRILKGKHVLTH